MTGDTIVQIVGVLSAMVVTVVTIWTRADVQSLKAEIVSLKATIASGHALLLQQNEIISNLTERPIQPIEKMGRPVHNEPTDQPYTSMPPYRPDDRK